MFPFPCPLLAAAGENSSGGLTSGQVIITTTGAGSINFATDSRFTGFNPSNNTIEMIAAGANGMLSAGTGSPGKGGGGGQYAKITNFDPGGGTISYQVGVGGGSQGTSASPGTGDSWFNSSTSTLYAQAGKVQSDGVAGGGTGGGAAAAVGSSTVANGGNGGGSSSVDWGGAGGGGAGGPHGAGAAGGGTASSGAAGGSGGSGDFGNIAGGTGVAGAAGNAGSTENYWGTGYGPGSGGAGGSATNASIFFRGGDGGNYGGGGGGGGYRATTRAQGGQGILVITWAP